MSFIVNGEEVNEQEYAEWVARIQRSIAAEEAEARRVEEAAEATRPLTAEEAISAILAASPTLTVAITDRLAMRMAPYLPAYDSMATYTVGTLVVMDNAIKRRTIGGWRDVTGA